MIVVWFCIDPAEDGATHELSIFTNLYSVYRWNLIVADMASIERTSNTSTHQITFLFEIRLLSINRLRIIFINLVIGKFVAIFYFIKHWNPIVSFCDTNINIDLIWPWILSVQIVQMFSFFPTPSVYFSMEQPQPTQFCMGIRFLCDRKIRNLLNINTYFIGLIGSIDVIGDIVDAWIYFKCLTNGTLNAKWL